MVSLQVCIGSACHVKGSYNVIHTFQQLIEENNLFEKIEIKAVFCLGQCTSAVSVKVDESDIYSVSGETARSFFKEKVIPAVD